MIKRDKMEEKQREFAMTGFPDEEYSQSKSKENKVTSSHESQANNIREHSDPYLEKGRKDIHKPRQVNQSRNEILSNNSLKNEKVDKEIEDLAKKIKIANTKKLVQIRNTCVIQNSLLTEKEPVVEETPEDWTSIRGQFGWAEVANTSIPYLTRYGEKYVSLRMAENKVFIKYKHVFTDEIRSCFSVKILHITSAEAQLLNEINFRHCDNFFGRLEFTMSDGIISYKDFIEMYHFLNFCHLRLIEKVAVPQHRCGFIKISGQNCVPYVWYNSKQYVPLFYFEGECKYLEERSADLSGWELAYLKLYCKIQGIRKSLFDEESIHVVDLELVKRFFPPNTVFEETWPTEYNIDSLVQKPLPKLVFSQNQNNEKQASSDNDKLNLSLQNGVKKNEICPENHPVIPQKKYVSIVPNTTRTSEPLHVTNQTSSRMPQSCPTANRSAHLGSNNLQYTPIVHNQQLSAMRNNKVPVPNNSLPRTAANAISTNTDYQQAFVRSSSGSSGSVPNSFVGFKPNSLTRMNPGLYKRGSNVLQIPEVSFNNAYYIVRSQVENKCFQYCINMEPYITNILLVLLEEGALFFKLPLDLFINAVNVMNIDIFLPNKLQKKEFEKVKVHSTKGLLKLSDFIDNLPQIRYILNKTQNFN